MGIQCRSAKSETSSKLVLRHSYRGFRWLRTADDTDIYNGAPNRYNWVLKGKKELYIPYHNYELINPKLKYEDILKRGHVNPEHTRYELHRVWVIEGQIKPGSRHVYSKRVLYLDEDSWGLQFSINTTAGATCGG